MGLRRLEGPWLIRKFASFSFFLFPFFSTSWYTDYREARDTCPVLPNWPSTMGMAWHAPSITRARREDRAACGNDGERLEVSASAFGFGFFWSEML
jgi:hypothetical protein